MRDLITSVVGTACILPPILAYIVGWRTTKAACIRALERLGTWMDDDPSDF
jgi:hypothetical protein